MPRIVLPTDENSWGGTLQAACVQSYENAARGCKEGYNCASFFETGRCRYGFFCDRAHTMLSPTVGSRLPEGTRRVLKRFLDKNCEVVHNKAYCPAATDRPPKGWRSNKRYRRAAAGPGTEDPWAAATWILSVIEQTGLLNPNQAATASHRREALEFLAAFPEVPDEDKTEIFWKANAGTNREHPIIVHDKQWDREWYPVPISLAPRGDTEGHAAKEAKRSRTDDR